MGRFVPRIVRLFLPVTQHKPQLPDEIFAGGMLRSVVQVSYLVLERLAGIARKP
jgi:hypothetical protein